MIARKTVMISSTARDLPEHRDEVRVACERAGYAPHDMMEHLTALNADAIAASLGMVEKAEVYLGIFAYRYGYVPEGHDVSITEMEYDRAVQLDKPRLIFFIHQDHPVTGKDVETGSGAAKLAALKDRIGQARVVAFFKSPQDLRGHVVEALGALAKEAEEAGPQAASERTVAKLHRKASISQPPEPYVAHPYTLLQTRELVGRRAELNLLTDWVSKPEAVTQDAAIFAIVAIGGMGKSAHAWTWFNQIAPNEMKPLAGRMWWSFYESDATFENFINRALCYVSGDDEQKVRRLPWQERERLLLLHLSEKPYLFGLDGLERALMAYNRMDASLLADDEYDEKTANYVTGAVGLPASAAQSFVGQHRLRQTTDPRAGAFLQKLAQVKLSRILITTRLYPTELQLPTGRPRAGCFAYFLQGLTDDEAVALWRGLGVSGSREELIPIFRSIQNHPMLIQALATEVANYRKAPGDFAAWRANHPKFDPTSLPLVQSRTHILDFALRGLSKEHREVLHTIVGFRMPASYATIEALLVGPGKLFGGTDTLDIALTALEDRGLIGWDREANRYDSHPVVRGVVWQLAGSGDKHAVMVALDQHFESIPTPDMEGVESLADLTPAIERFHTLVELGKYDEAFLLFDDRLHVATFYRLSAHRERIAWLERLIVDGPDGYTCLCRRELRRFVFMALGISYDFSGQPGKAILLLKQAVASMEDEEVSLEFTVPLSNIGIAMGQCGQLAEGSLYLMKALFHSRDSESQEKVVLREIGRCEAIIGNYDNSLTAFNRAMKTTRQLHPQFLGVTFSHFAEHQLWIGNYAKAMALADQALDLAGHARYEADFIRASLLKGRAELGLGKTQGTNERLHDALVRARAANVAEFELPILIAIAELEFKNGLPELAIARLDETWEALQRGPYPLIQADAYNLLAGVQASFGKKSEAVEAANCAFKAAWCDGPPFAYAYGLGKARNRLASLGAPEPVPPAFVQAEFEPWPDVEINPKDENWVDPDNLIWDIGIPL